MQHALKQRLVGAAVLLAVAVSVIPLLLGEADREAPIVTPRVPPSPIIDAQTEVVDVEHAYDSGPHAETPTLAAAAPLPVPTASPQPTPKVQVPAPAFVAGRPARPVESPTRAISRTVSPKADSKRALKPQLTTEPAADVTRLPPAKDLTVPRPSAELHAAWMVQVGTFTVARNAHALEARLTQSGFNAHVEKVLSGNRPGYRVRVGPEQTRDQARQLKDRIAARLGLEGMVSVDKP